MPAGLTNRLEETMKWYLGVWKQYATFKGRAQRREYWMFLFLNMSFILAMALVAGIVGIFIAVVPLKMEGDSVMQAGALAAGLVTFVYSLAVFTPALAVTVRRMHDSGRSGWWMFVPLVSFILLCLNSQANNNRYGPRPNDGERPQGGTQVA
jgi:uncharacterized membrane protein YhaH (DUF805 family)